jgi:hypothetical protein
VVHEAADFQVNAIRAQHEQNKKMNNEQKGQSTADQCRQPCWFVAPFWCTLRWNHQENARKKWSGPYRVSSAQSHTPHCVLIETHSGINLPFKQTCCTHWPCQVQKTIPLHT